VAPIFTGIIVHFRFHIRCISIHKLLYFDFFSASFCTTFLSAGIAGIIIIIIIQLPLRNFASLIRCSFFIIRQKQLVVVVFVG